MKIAIIGCGVMGSALARHFSKEHAVILCDQGHEKSAILAKELGAEVYARHTDAIEKADVVVLAVKPKNLDNVSQTTRPAFTKEKLILSVLAGTPLSLLRNHFPRGVIVRMMPNLALICGEGVIGLVNDPTLEEKFKKVVTSLLSGLGLLTWLPEDKLDALTALTGSGPAFLSVMIEAMIDSGLSLGFTLHESKDFVLKTLEGTVALLRHTGMHPAELKWKVASPGGTTVAGLKVLESSSIRGAIMHTFAAAFGRAHDLHTIK